MIHIERSNDEGLIRYVIYQLWDEVAPNGASPEDFELDTEEEIWLEVWDDLEILGVYKFHDQGFGDIMAHANVLPEHRQKNTEEITKAVSRWLQENLDSDYKRLVVCIPTDKPNVLKYADRIGLKEKAKILSMPLEDFYRYGKE